MEQETPERERIEDVFTLFDRIHERDRRTDRQTDDTAQQHDIGRAMLLQLREAEIYPSNLTMDKRVIKWIICHCKSIGYSGGWDFSTGVASA